MIKKFFAAFLLLLGSPSLVQGVEIQEIMSPGGINAWLVEDHTIPFTALEIEFAGGASLEDTDKYGSAYFLTGMFEEGAGDLDAAEFQRQQQELAAEFSFDANRENISVSVRFLTEYKDESLELLKLALEKPRFDEDRLEFVRKQIQAIISRSEKDLGDIAFNNLNRLTYGDHPFGRPIEGTQESVQGITGEDLELFRQKAVTRGGVIVAAAGDITSSELGELLDNLLGGLALKEHLSVSEPEFLLKEGTTLIDFPSPQSTVVFRQEGILRNDPDFLTAYVLNEILGSYSYSSRLREEVREKRGLTYGIGSYLGAYSNSGFMGGQFSTDNNSVAEAIEVVKSEWARFATEGVTEEELNRVKTYLMGAYPLRFDGNGRIASILAGMQSDRFPASYVKNRNDMVAALTVEDINRVARRLLNPDKLHFVVVGQPVGLN